MTETPTQMRARLIAQHRERIEAERLQDAVRAAEREVVRVACEWKNSPKQFGGQLIDAVDALLALKEGTK